MFMNILLINREGQERYEKVGEAGFPPPPTRGQAFAGINGHSQEWRITERIIRVENRTISKSKNI